MGEVTLGLEYSTHANDTQKPSDALEYVATFHPLFVVSCVLAHLSVPFGDAQNHSEYIQNSPYCAF